jgi:hypothetical protein
VHAREWTGLPYEVGSRSTSNGCCIVWFIILKRSPTLEKAMAWGMDKRRYGDYPLQRLY